MNTSLDDNKARAEKLAATIADPNISQEDKAKAVTADAVGRTGIVVNTDGVEIDTVLGNKAAGLILQSAKQATSLTRQMFNLIYQSGNYSKAAAMWTFAESEALIAANKEEGRTFKNLKELAEYNGMKMLSYTQLKSTIMNGIYQAGAHKALVQEWYTFRHKHENEAISYVDPGFLNPWAQETRDGVVHRRYGDPKTGATQFMKDLRHVGECKTLLEAGRARVQRAAAAAQAATNQAGSDTQQQVASGGRAGTQQVQVTPKLEGARGQLMLSIGEAWTVTKDEDGILGVIDTAIKGLKALIATKHEATRAAAAETGHKPSEAMAEVQRKAREERERLDQQDEPDVDALPDLTDHDKANIDDIENSKVGTQATG